MMTGGKYIYAADFIANNQISNLNGHASPTAASTYLEADEGAVAVAWKKDDLDTLIEQE